MFKKFFDFTKWQVLETYTHNGTALCVQVRMNKRTGYKFFRVNRITTKFGYCSLPFPVEKINELTETKTIV